MPERAADGGRLPPPEKVKALFDRGDPESENAAPWARRLEEAGVTGPGVPPTGDSPPLWPAGPAPQNPRTNVLAMWAVNFFIASWFQSGVLTDGEHYTRNFSGDFDMGYVYGQTKEQQAFLMNKEDGTVRVNSSGRPLRYMDADNGPFSPESSDTLKACLTLTHATRSPVFAHPLPRPSHTPLTPLSRLPLPLSRPSHARR